MASSGHGDIGNARGCTLEGVSTKKIAWAKVEMVRTAQTLVRIQLGERKRRYPAHFASKLTDSDGENAETQHWLKTALTCGYIDQATHDTLLHESESIGSKLGKMIANAEQWKPRDS